MSENFTLIDSLVVQYKKKTIHTFTLNMQVMIFNEQGVYGELVIMGLNTGLCR